MKKYGLLGEKLSHSYSPIIHNYVFEKLNIDASYELIECSVDDLSKYIDLIKSGVYSGYNVTIPYKKSIMKYLDVLVDGAFIKELKDTKLHWKGSSNQRVINMPETRKTGEIVLVED